MDCRAALPMTGGDREAGWDDIVLDLRGLHCPMPVLRARKALLQIAVGQAVVLECTDPLSTLDLPHFAAEAGHAITVEPSGSGLYRFRIVRLR